MHRWSSFTILAQVSLRECVLLPSWHGDLGVDPGGQPPRLTAPTLMAVALCCLPRLPLNVLAMSKAIQTVVSMYAPRRTTDTVMDTGNGVSHSVPFYRSYAPPQAVHRFVLRSDLARRDFTE